MILFGLTAFGSSANAQQIEVWVDFEVHGDIAYLLRQSPQQIMRFDLNSESWLSPIALSDIPNAFVLTDSHIFVAYDSQVVRLPVNGGSETHVHNTPDSIDSLLIDGDILIVNRSAPLYSRLTSVDVNTFDQLDEIDEYVHSTNGASLAPSINKIFGRTQGISPSDIVMLDYDDSGMFGTVNDSPYHSTYPGGTRAWVFADETRVLDSSGTVYSTSDLTYSNSLGVSVVDMTFVGTDIPIVLTPDDELVSFSNAMLETGRTSIQAGAKDIAVHGSDVFVFREDETQPTEVNVQIVPLSTISPDDPGQPISPIDLAYEVKDSVADSRGITYIISNAHPAIFRYDLATQAYIGSVPLPELADSLVYSPDLDRVYVYAGSRRIYLVDNLADVPSVAQFTTAPLEADTLIALGSDLLVARNSSWSGWREMYGSNGELLDADLPCCYSHFHFYDHPRERLFTSDGWLQYVGNGTFGETVDGPPAIATSNTGQLAVDADGFIYNTANMTAIDALSNEISQAAWMNNSRLYTVEDHYPASEENATVQRWNEYFVHDIERTIVGSLAGFHGFSDQLLLIMDIDGKPSFKLLNPFLQEVPPPTLATPDLRLEDFSSFFARLSWDDISGEREYVVERKQEEETTWTVIATLDADETDYVDSTLSTGNVYQFRIFARNGSVLSDYSAVVDVDLQGVVDDRVDPEEVTFIADDVSLGANGRVYVLSREHDSIFTWNTVLQQWGVTIPLQGVPDYVAYSNELPVAFAGYDDGTINSISLASANPVEIPFVELPEFYLLNCGMEVAGAYLITCNYGPDVAWDEHRSYNMSGSLIDAKSWRYEFHGGAWSETNRVLYHFRDGTSPNDLIATPIDVDGMIGEDEDSPYHSSLGIQYPIRVAPDGSVVILGSGRVYDASTLEHIDDLPGPIEDGMWLDGELLTSSGGEISRHSTDYSVIESIDLGQTVLRILPISATQFVVVTRTADDNTRLRIFDADFSEVPPPIFVDSFE